MADIPPPEDLDDDDLDQPDASEHEDDREADDGPDADGGDLGEDADEPDGTGDEPPPSQDTRDQPDRSRGNRQFGEMRRQNRELKRRLEQLEQTRPQAPAFDQNAEAERRRQQQQREADEEQQVVLTGDPAQIARFYNERSTRQVNERLGRTEFFTADNADRTAFERACDRFPAYDKVADEVEKRLGMARQQGMNPQRVALAKLIIGERYVERMPAAKNRQQKQADGEKRRQQARPSSARSDQGSGRASGNRGTGGGRQSEHEARARRLDDSGSL